MALHIPSNADLTALLYFSALLRTFSSSSWITMRRFIPNRTLGMRGQSERMF